MQNDKAFQRLRAISLSVNHIHDVFLELLALSESTGPTVTSSSSLLRDEYIFRVVEISIGAHLDGVYDLTQQKGTLGSKSMRIDLGM